MDVLALTPLVTRTSLITRFIESVRIHSHNLVQMIAIDRYIARDNHCQHSFLIMVGTVNQDDSN